MKVNNKIREFVSEFKESYREYYVIVVDHDDMVGTIVDPEIGFIDTTGMDFHEFDSVSDCMDTIKQLKLDGKEYEIYRVVDGGLTFNVI